MKKNYLITILIIILILITLSTHTTKKEITIKNDIKTTSNDKYDKNTTYYKKLKYKTFKKLYESKEVSTIAITTNTSNTNIKFIELINTISYKNKIYLLNISNLKKKNQAKFYNLNSKFKELNTDYIMVVSNNKILSITTFEKEELNTLIKYYKGA